jgi:ligand-binding sensor domain-containing protein
MARYFIILMLLILTFESNSQTPVGVWSDHLSYNSVNNLAIGKNEIYASTGYSIMIYNKEFDELRKLTRVQGLSETGISSIAFSTENNTLIISYNSTNIDLVKENLVYNVPDIKRKYIPGSKEIYRIRTQGKYAYLAGSFGIVVLDLVKHEIADTWKPGPGGDNTPVYDIAFGNNRIYAATFSGVYYADPTTPGLSYFGNWNLIKSLPASSSSYNAVIVSGTKLYVNRNVKTAAGDSVFVIDNSAALFSFQPGTINRSFDLYNGGFTISSQNGIRVFNDAGKLLRTITSFNTGTPNVSQSLVDGNDIWIADISSGLYKGLNMTAFSNLVLPGPATNNVVSIINKSSKTYITGGALDNTWNNQWRDLQLFTQENNSWNSVISPTLKDPMRILPDPSNSNHYWVSTWGMGLLEYENNLLINHYDDSNSPLKTIIAGAPYSRVCGLAMDKSRNIWMTQTGVQGTIKVLKPDKTTWITFPITLDAPTIGDIIITRSGYKWIVIPRGNGLFVLDDNNTPDNFSDDRYKSFLVKDNEGNVLSNIFSIAEDLDGNIWVGTDEGPAIYYNEKLIFSDDPRAYRIIIPRNDGSGLGDYLLKSEIITSIAVDGANRKWIGTMSSGTYLLSADGTKKIVNYSEENSPLYSNSIAGIAIDDKTGEVWMGTAMGVISLRGDATTGGEEFKNVYSFPNPVRSNYSGNVTITGLMRDSRIKITDVSGNLVFETVSDGGQATWNLKTFTGERVSTGVYIVFCASSDGSASAVTKMLVIK